jgi:hypothetical protein
LEAAARNEMERIDTDALSIFLCDTPSKERGFKMRDLIRALLDTGGPIKLPNQFDCRVGFGLGRPLPPETAPSSSRFESIIAMVAQGERSRATAMPRGPLYSPQPTRG